MTTITMKEVAAFLLGEASLDGYWFGERHPISPFWWREHLRASQPATAPAQPEIVDLLAEMYELILANKVVLAEKSGGVWTWPDRAIEAVRKHRSGPAQPAWHDAPTCEGMWISDDFEGISTFNSDDIQAFKTNTGVRWYGPIPEDRQ